MDFEKRAPKRYALLCGSAPDGFYQQKIDEMHGFLVSEAGGAWAEKEIMIFPNGVTEELLSFLLERLRADGMEFVFLYICTLSPVFDSDKTVWLGGSEVQRSVIESFCAAGGMQAVYDCGRELAGAEELGYERASAESAATRRARAGAEGVWARGKHSDFL
ncbi:MAG: hypothetical protein NC041_05315 [Bacteroides sp.]|nr:hypothetical protein [Prevotella sp.]MCM1407375.1 hypothetical protein [Treponema brennaborense]MCM1469865.1 hypothetical protein [Bacteroides sp.]